MFQFYELNSIALLSILIFLLWLIMTIQFGAFTIFTGLLA
jgi:hypothetical protein